MTGIDRAAVREEIRAGVNAAVSNGGRVVSYTGWSPSAEVDRVTDAVMARVTPVLGREELAHVIVDEWMRHVAAQTRNTPLGHCLAYADALLASGRIRSEAEVKAEALREAADDWYGDDGAWDKRGSEATWLRDRADALAPARKPDGGVVAGATS